mgnify:CR=1 FL=1
MLVLELDINLSGQSEVFVTQSIIFISGELKTVIEIEI